MTHSAGRGSDAQVAALLRDYRTAAGVSDELFGRDGTLRPVWKPFIRHLAGLTADEIAARFGRGDRHLHDAGVYYRKYDTSGPSERDWPLSHIPVIIHDTEWQTIATGLRQRADLLEAVAEDLYGENKLISEGYLPASLTAQNQAWLRPLVGVRPVSGHHLHFLAFEIGRGPDGKWWVLGDRTEAPSGAGFALENRIASTRIYPNFYGDSGIHRLAGFFRAFQTALTAGRSDPDGLIAILTPGPMNDAYFEHAYVARHLGFLLAQGEDLTVQNGKVMVRTVDGLKPVSVLWRRLDGATCDPIELDEHSAIGTPGLVDAVRQGNVSLVNALGSGVLETRAMMSFLPKISRVLTGQPLALPNIATWWCGQKRERDHVLANRDTMMIGSAYSSRLPFNTEDGSTVNRVGAKTSLEELLDQDGRDLVGQEAVTLSTTPVWHDGRLVPRPMILRVFLARTKDGWQVMPGGYARVGSGHNTPAIAMQQGGAVADVWVQSDRPNPQMPAPALRTQQFETQIEEALPSRAADNLFWLGRYVERAEGNIRLFRAYFARESEGVAPDRPLLKDLRQTLSPGAGKTFRDLTGTFELPLQAALASAGQVRDRLSVDALMSLRDLSSSVAKMAGQSLTPDEIPRKASVLLRKITGFSGLVHENMYRSTGWRFLSLGMSLERAATMATVLAALAHEEAAEGALEVVLEVGDSTMAHRLRYAGGASHHSVADLMALDGKSPRSILYHLSRSRSHIDHLPGSAEHGRMSPTARLALQLQTRLAVETPGTLTTRKLLDLRRDIWRLSDLLTLAYLK
ncbi:circularly permuted type 2 ATP-grasp protein [Pseudoruegeria sp. SK021]|uniref:circularly permuted type 2 ATP-grasp protein n=1 Tax=Pseudoruegeria sp. SK021 TaxID=1933035 RepID=UPI000A25B172|nr:circularly permuted type 2 ATP-grasp protein [Pseudoruegeria sp. SK021]OSP56560.1 hypothetical protein BV911_00935 [Pseudoruegeria sp. SK021]